MVLDMITYMKSKSKKELEKEIKKKAEDLGDLYEYDEDSDIPVYLKRTKQKKIKSLE